ncbi:hypothetical protein BC940DRAFT_331272 [Gongronella butleri]|nr:hypothetical protein BC940DRAFT_331272 [Gongronella butleri]
MVVLVTLVPLFFSIKSAAAHNLAGLMPGLVPPELVAANAVPPELVAAHAVPHELLHGHQEVPYELIGNHAVPNALVGGQADMGDVYRYLLGNHMVEEDGWIVMDEDDDEEDEDGSEPADTTLTRTLTLCSYENGDIGPLTSTKVVSPKTTTIPMRDLPTATKKVTVAVSDTHDEFTAIVTQTHAGYIEVQEIVGVVKPRTTVYTTAATPFTSRSTRPDGVVEKIIGPRITNAVIQQDAERPYTSTRTRENGMIDIMIGQATPRTTI